MFLTTTIAPSVATCTTMAYTWIKNGNSDVSMCLNASLAGLVGITAGCDALDAIGAALVGVVSGILVVMVVEGLDLKLHIDDPVGAVGVHCANGIWGTLAVSLLANPDAPAGLSGLLYTGSWEQLSLQVIGVVSISAYATVMMCITFAVTRKVHGLRCEAEAEIRGLDVAEHGLPSAYADFAFAVSDYADFAGVEPVVAVTGDVPAAEAVPVKRMPAFEDGVTPKFTKVEIVFKEEKLYALKDAMMALALPV